MQNDLTEKEICQRCILPDTFPGIQFNNHGICKYCLKEESIVAKGPEKKSEYRRNLDQLIKDIKGKAPVYDAIMAYSGGKDSTYTLKLLRERYNLRIVSLTFDNHFVSPAAWENIKTVTDALQVDHISFRLPWPVAQRIFSLTAREDIFSKPTLLRASSICTACIGLVKSLVLKNALEMSIPLVAFGWSPGQAPIQSAIMKTNPALIRQTQSALKKAFPAEIYSSLDNYFIPDDYYEKFKDRFPQNIHPLAFFDYDEEQIKEELTDIGWKAPTDTDTNSSNCLLNAFANQRHIERNDFHPYVWEIANMVRQGVMDRGEGIRKIYSDQNQKMVEYAKERLGL
jgi:tRNA(Ile)-lysidine synthase TilS/MesJ